MKLAKQLGEAMPKELGVREIEPGADADTDEGLLDYIRANADTASAAARASAPTTWPSSTPSCACMA